jgi:outer membrane murein-binding lipoprotein Lpp
MKRMLIGVLLLNILAFSGCALSPDDGDKDAQIEDLSQQVDDLQNQLDENNSDTETTDNDTNTDSTDTTDTSDTTDTTDTAYIGDSYITLNSPANESSFTEEPILFNGVVSPDTQKIVVTWKAAAQASGDTYQLQNFKAGDTSFKYSAKVSYLNLSHGTNNYEFKAYFDDGSTKSTNVQIYYVAGGAEMGKPVIYLYPETTMKVSVNVEPVSGISVSVPEIGKGWDVIATPTGKIINSSDSKVYPYLFWEGFASNFVRPTEGFVVEKGNVNGFFDEKLAVLGLNENEIADFKEFWLPKLATDSYYFITFVPQNEFDKYAPLTVNPAPDTIIRVFFDYQGLSEKKAVTEQILEKRERKGFSVIEWGGRLY